MNPKLSMSLLCGISFLAATAGPAAGVTPLAIDFQNDSGLPASQVYIGFVGGSSFDATNIATGAALSLSTYANPSWYTLDQLPQGIDLTGYSGRIYVGYGSPWTFLNPGYEPPPTVASDPNYLKRYDKLELTYDGNPADVADTTSIDYFGIPISMAVYKSGTSGTRVGSLRASSTAVTENALRGLTSPAGAAIVTDSSGNFVRAIGPGAYPPTGGLPASPYNNFGDYLNYLQGTYGPAHAGVVATIQGYFGGVGSNPTTPATKGQNYSFTATMDSSDDILLTGTGTQVGAQTLLFKYADLVSPTGIYGANPNFYLNGSSSSQSPQNDIDGWITGDLLAGLNIGAVGSTVVQNGQTVGTMPSQQWFGLTNLFSGLQPTHSDYYNQWAAALNGISNAYSFAYSDRFAPVTATLNPAAVDTLQVDIGGSIPVSTTWTSTAGGSWGTSGNWTGGVIPTNAGDTATFASAITSPATVSLDSARSVGTLIFNSSLSYTITGTPTLTLDNAGVTASVMVITGSHMISVPVSLLSGVTINTAASTSLTIGGSIAGNGPLIKSGPGGLTLSGSNLYTGGTNISAGTMTLATNTSLPAFSPLTVGAGASVVVLPSATKSAVTINGLTDNGTVDLTDNDAIVRGSTLAAVVALVTQGDLISSTAAADTRHLTALGVIQNGTLFGSTTAAGQFDGISPAPSDILVRYTYFGDANLDGKVDGSDYTLIDAGYLSHGTLTGWANGDFNYDGVIDGTDYSLIDNAFNNQTVNLSTAVLSATSTAEVSVPAAAVPEPGMLAVIAAAAGSLIARRRSRQ